jgi:hypothetical protein
LDAVMRGIQRDFWQGGGLVPLEAKEVLATLTTLSGTVGDSGWGFLR